MQDRARTRFFCSDMCWLVAIDWEDIMYYLLVLFYFKGCNIWSERNKNVVLYRAKIHPLPGKHCWRSPAPAVYRPPWPPWFPSLRCTLSPTPESRFSLPAPPHGPQRGYDHRSNAAICIKKNCYSKINMWSSVRYFVTENFKDTFGSKE